MTSPTSSITTPPTVPPTTNAIRLSATTTHWWNLRAVTSKRSSIARPPANLNSIVESGMVGRGESPEMAVALDEVRFEPGAYLRLGGRVARIEHVGVDLFDRRVEGLVLPPRREWDRLEVCRQAELVGDVEDVERSRRETARLAPNVF